jgi:hypothetical protein
LKRLTVLLALTIPLAAQTISPAAIEAHMRFLADDVLEGRETGTRGFDVAAAYVAAQFEGAGLSTTMQPIAFRSARILEQSLRVGDKDLIARKDFVLQAALDGAVVDVTAPVAVAGYGITAPDAGHDDYKMVDVRGKVVMILSGAPASFGIDQRAFYSSTALKQKTAADHGAIAVLMVNSRTDEKRTPFERAVQQSGLQSMRYLEADGKPADMTSLKFYGRISWDVARQLMFDADIAFDTMLREAENNATYSLPLKATVTVHETSATANEASANVVGIVRGTDAALRNEYLVVSAHLDHLGIHERAGTTDTINNGAQDNASGIACLIEIARAIGRNPPRRSLLFVAFTGEEKGEQGSRYFARHPTVQKSAIVADINMDMPLMLYPLAGLIALGGEHSGLGPLAVKAAAEEKLAIDPDPLPEEVRFIRSDQFSFVQEGIPAIHMKSGRSSDPSIDANAVTREWLRTIYHSPADDMSQKLDFNAGAKYADTNLRLIRAAADAPQRIGWNRGDFFGALFAK